jgi:flagellar biosynthesis/type III secretory pathway M-ring protein FliF/YscJ
VNTLKAWVNQNKSIAIPVFLFGSIAVLLAIGWIVWFVVRRHRHKRRIAEKEKDSRPPSVVKAPQDIELVEMQQEQQQVSPDEPRRTNFITKAHTHRRGRSIAE